MDLRERVVAFVEGGGSRRGTARHFAISPSGVITGSAAPGAMGGRKPYALAGREDLVRSLVAAQPDLTLEELRTTLAARRSRRA